MPILTMPMWEDAGNKAHDYSGNRNDETIVNATWQDGGINFDAAGEKLSGNEPGLAKAGTISFFFKSTSNQSTTGKFFITTDAEFQLYRYTLDNKISLSINGVERVAASSLNLWDDTERHFVITWDEISQDTFLYIDKVKYTLAGDAWTFPNLSPTLFFGNRDDGERQIGGIIKIPTAFSKVLNLTQINTLYNNPSGMFEPIRWPAIWSIPSGDTYTLNAESGSFSLAGQATELLVDRLLGVDAGSFALSGTALDLLLNRLFSAESGTFSLTGQSVNLFLNRLLSAESGSFSLSGTNVNLLLGRVLGAEAGSFTLTGTDVDLIYSGTGPTYTLTAETGSFALTGTDASLLVSRILATDSGSFALSGQDANLLLNRLLAAGSGSFTLSGQDVTLLTNRILNTEAGAFTLDGQNAGLLLGRILSAETGQFALTGQDITLLANRRLNAEEGIFNLIGSDVTLTWSGATLAVGKLTITFTPRKPGTTLS